MFRSISFIKTLHSLAFIILSIANLIVLFSALTGKITKITLWSFAFVMVEGIVLMFNGWRCPLRIYAERIGAVSGQVTDIFLPKWFADRIFPICTSMLAFSIFVMLARFLGGYFGLFAPLQLTSIF